MIVQNNVESGGRNLKRLEGEMGATGDRGEERRAEKRERKQFY